MPTSLRRHLALQRWCPRLNKEGLRKLTARSGLACLQKRYMQGPAVGAFQRAGGGSCRFTWEVIKRNRTGRAIVLTSHSMEEADLLGDVIAIMAEGKLAAYGTALDLKSQYGVGYTLTVVRSRTRWAGKAPIPTVGPVVLPPCVRSQASSSKCFLPFFSCLSLHECKFKCPFLASDPSEKGGRDDCGEPRGLSTTRWFEPKCNGLWAVRSNRETEAQSEQLDP